ncbi:MAG: alpha/beta fold hydrolase [Lentisphaeria bacterium]
MTATTAFFISGWAHGAAALRPLAAALPELDARLLAPAELGAEPAAALLDRIQAAGAAPVVLVGWSLGAMIALEAALARPAAVARLILVAGTPRFCATDGWPAGQPQANLRALAAGLRHDAPAALRGFFELCGTAPETLSGLAAAALDQGTETLAAGLHYLRAKDLRPNLHTLAVPTLLLHGKQDQVIPWLAASLLAQQIRSARLRLFDPAGHNLPQTHPSELAAASRDFLAPAP